MSRSPRRRKDRGWCRACDRMRVLRHGYGHCKECRAILARRRKRLVKAREE